MTCTKAQLRARDVMTPEPVCVEPSTTIRQLARILEENEVSGSPVVDSAGALVGVVSRTDLIRRCAEGTTEVPPKYLFEMIADQGGGDDDEVEVSAEALICVDDFMTPDVVTAGPDAPVSEIARLMYERRIHRVIIADEERFPLGIVTSLDLLGVFPK